MILSKYEEIAIEMFETLLDDFDAIPSVLQKCIMEKIIPDFDRLIASMRSGFIALNIDRPIPGR